jgi:hypothetical protein
VIRSGAGLELVYGECNRCGKRAETLFTGTLGMFWAGQATCEHGPHERPALFDQRVRDVIATADELGVPVSHASIPRCPILNPFTRQAPCGTRRRFGAGRV